MSRKFKKMRSLASISISDIIPGVIITGNMQVLRASTELVGLGGAEACPRKEKGGLRRWRPLNAFRL